MPNAQQVYTHLKLYFSNIPLSASLRTERGNEKESSVYTYEDHLLLNPNTTNTDLCGYLQCRQITLYNETADILIKRGKKGWASFPVIRRVNDLYIAEEIATTTFFFFFLFFFRGQSETATIRNTNRSTRACQLLSTAVSQASTYGTKNGVLKPR